MREKLPPKKYTPLVDKLAYILSIASDREYGPTHPFIADLLRAFQDELKRQQAHWPFGTPETTESLQELVNKSSGYMTGQEWYERFSNELKKLVSRGDGETFMGWDCGEVREAARKAAGL